MDQRKTKTLKILVTSFISVTVAIAVTTENVFLAFIGIVIGVLFLALVRRKSGEPIVDERIESISTRAARLTYSVITVFLSLLSVVLIIAGRKSGETYIEALGNVFAYIACLNLAIYSISYRYFDKIYGGDN